MQNNNNEYNKLRNNIKQIIDEEVEQLFQQKNLFETHSGIIMDIKEGSMPYEQKCNVDLVFTTLTDILNKSGQLLSVGDSVVVFSKIGSHFSNCFIAFKNS